MARTPRDWTIFSHHGIVLYHIIVNPDLTILEIARSTGLSESWVRRIVSDLEEADIVRVEKRGVQNHYSVNPEARLRHPSQHHITIGDLVRGISPRLVTTTTDQPGGDATTGPDSDLGPIRG